MTGRRLRGKPRKTGKEGKSDERNEVKGERGYTTDVHEEGRMEGLDEEMSMKAGKVWGGREMTNTTTINNE